MKVFISWSGRRSRIVAEALNDWLPKVIQAVQPFYSAEMEKGAQWSTQIDAALEGTSFGIVCLTPENLDSRWIHFEAGALSKLPESRVWTFLLDLRPGGVDHPLGKFQATIAEKNDVKKLLAAINSQLSMPLAISVLDDAFEVRWPALDEKLKAATAAAAGSKPKITRDQGAILEEILAIIRAQERRMEVVEDTTGSMHSQIDFGRLDITFSCSGPREADAFMTELARINGVRGQKLSKGVGRSDYVVTADHSGLPSYVRQLVEVAAEKVGVSLRKIIW